MKGFLATIAILAIVLGGAAHAGAPTLSSLEMGAPGEMCFGQDCGNMEHGAMPMAECVAHCLQSGIDVVGSADFSFAGQVLPVLAAAFFGAVFIVVALSFAGRKFREREYFAKLFIGRNLRSVILLD